MNRNTVEALEQIARSKSTWTEREAFDWCRAYASAHYENFQVLSLFLPRAHRDDYAALYAFARGADWRADDIAAQLPSQLKKKARLEALQEWRRYLDETYSEKQPSHPAFIALRHVVRRHSIEQSLFEAMVRTFERDQGEIRFPTWNEVLDYTEGSANPVGRWVLRVHGYDDGRLDRLSDSVCTGLQLVNFMQDIRTDLAERNRVYLPLEDLQRFGVTAEMLAQAPSPGPVRELLAFEAERAEHFLSAGLELMSGVHGPLRRQLVLFHGGGLLALGALKRVMWDAGSRHRRVGGLAKGALVFRAFFGWHL